MLIDTHAHINFKDYKDDGDQVIKRALDEDIQMILVGSQWETSQRAVKYAQKYKEGVYAAIGLHPSHLKEQKVKEEGEIEYETRQEEFDVEKYQQLVQEKKVVAIGEIGLDYYRLDNEEDQYKQKQVFMEQLDLARQSDKPIIVHCREAYDDLLSLLSAFNIGCAGCSSACGGSLRGVIHCFAGSLEIARQLINLGFYLGFNGLITFTDEYDEIIKEISLENILLETDCPYLTPVPYRGKRNEPLYVKKVAERIAQIKEIDFDQVAEQTTKNAKELFGI